MPPNPVPPGAPPQPSRQLTTFFLDDLYLGIDVLNVQEVLRYQEMTRVPVASDVVAGLMNLRGQIVTVIEMRRRLNLAPRPAQLTPANVVVRSEEGAVSLLVDEVGDVIEAPRENFEPAPETLPQDTRDLSSGVYKLDGRILLVLDTEKVLQISNS